MSAARVLNDKLETRENFDKAELQTKAQIEKFESEARLLNSKLETRVKLDKLETIDKLIILDQRLDP